MSSNISPNTVPFIYPTIEPFFSEPFNSSSGFGNCVGFIIGGLSAGEFVTLQVYDPQATTKWHDGIQITSSEIFKSVWLNTFTFRLVKGTTINPVWVSIASANYIVNNNLIGGV